MRILLVGEVNSDNLGDRAIYVSLKQLFESDGYEVGGWDLSRNTPGIQDPESSSVESVAPHRRGKNSQTPGLRIKGRILQRLDTSPHWIRKAAVYLSKKRTARRMRTAWASELQNCDLVVFGGGALLSDNDWSFPLALVNFSRAARAVGKPYVCVGCSTGSRYSAMGRRWLQEFLDHCQYVALRDQLSLQGLHQLGEYRADVYADSALCIGDFYPRDPARNAGTMGINVIAAARHHRLHQQTHSNYLRELSSFVQAIANGEAGPWQRVLLFSTGDQQDYQAAKDLVAGLDLTDSSVEITAPEPGSTLAGLCELIAGLDLVISTRMHAGIIAKSYRRPLIAIAWDEKIRGFCRMIGIEEDCLDIELFRGELLLQKVRKFAGAGLKQADEVEERVSELKAVLMKVRKHVEETKVEC